MYALFWYVSYMPILKSFFFKGQKLQFFQTDKFVGVQLLEFLNSCFLRCGYVI